MDDFCYLSVVIPAYNESRRLGKTLDILSRYLAAQSFKYEIIIVDDGSMDRTPELVRDLAQLYPGIRLVGYSRNKGKGNAVRHGIQRSRGKLILVMDADGATPIAEFERLHSCLQDNQNAIIIGSRRNTASTRVRTALHRKIIGRIFNSFLFLLTPGIEDTQCGFKLFPASIAAQLSARQTLKGFAFDVEILHAALRNHIEVIEVPVNWNNQAGSKVNVLVDSCSMFFSLIAIGWHSLLNHYGLDEASVAYERDSGRTFVALR